MCILLKLDYAKFGVPNLFCFKSYRRETFGSRLLVKEGLTLISFEMKASKTKETSQANTQNLVRDGTFNCFWVSNQPYTPLLPKIIVG